MHRPAPPPLFYFILQRLSATFHHILLTLKSLK
jgi:hypothetical protein